MTILAQDKWSGRVREFNSVSKKSAMAIQLSAVELVQSVDSLQSKRARTCHSQHLAFESVKADLHPTQSDVKNHHAARKCQHHKGWSVANKEWIDRARALGLTGKLIRIELDRLQI